MYSINNRRRKRRLTKKQLLIIERSLVKRVRLYIQASKEERLKDDGMIGGMMGADLRRFLTILLKLEINWNDKNLWIDGIINAAVEIQKPNIISLQGKVVWGLINNISGTQWKEPLFANLKISNNKNRLTSYFIKFGDNQPIISKKVKVGMYPTILFEGWEKIFGEISQDYSDMEAKIKPMQYIFTKYK